MIKPKTITLTRAEGPISECGKPKTVASFVEADTVLRLWSSSAPEHGGYDKCDFTIIFEDGETYDGRFDLVHWRKERPDLAAHVRGFVNYLAGNPPGWLQRDAKRLERYQREIAHEAERTAGAKKWLETYSLEAA